MPNPSIPPQQFKPQPMEPNKHNGILAYVPAQFIAQGSEGLPKAGPGEQARQVVQVQVQGIGEVRITYELSSYKHRRSTHWHWRAVWAER